MNLFLGILQLIVCFSGVVVLEKLFGKYGLYGWMALAVVFANIQVSKQIDIAGVSMGMGNVMFASTYLATDILNEKYGYKSGKNAVKLSAAALIAYILFARFTALFVPNEYDVVDAGMQTLFAMSIRITTASGVMFLLSNWCDVLLYQKLKLRTGGKYMWFRNNVSTILCNCSENFGFTIMAFAGTFPLSYCLEAAIAGSVIEMIIAVSDTPFLYLAKASKGRSGILLEKDDEEAEDGLENVA
ncbi:queuosine precursor transporter [Butyrivibrio sp. MC2013]|uniref:queuosine precursor transporter n=1 Tax=Butyrivibrio sp. MC2013 TaxID=1280686 RepID=UPI000400C697|nr:queuosine precursor transporter [Butyrivibrio sp. MC2013]